jgi:hypothetical protein
MRPPLHPPAAAGGGSTASRQSPGAPPSSSEEDPPERCVPGSTLLEWPLGRDLAGLLSPGRRPARLASRMACGSTNRKPRGGDGQPLRSRCRGRRRPWSPARAGAAPVRLSTVHAPESEKEGPGTPLARSLQAPWAWPPRSGCRAEVLDRPSHEQGKAGAGKGRPGPGRR